MVFLVYENGAILLGLEVMLALGEYYGYPSVLKVCATALVVVGTFTSG